MVDRVVPMIHVPDVRATVDWYQDIGFTVTNTYGNEGDGLSFAILSFGDSEVMFNQGGQASRQRRREVDLYIYTDKVDEFYQTIKDRADVVEGPHDTFYGMREFIIRDLNRFWLTFAQASVFAALMTGVREGDIEAVRIALESGGLKPETLTLALATALAGDRVEIAEMLRKAGAEPPPEVDAETLQSYVGAYKAEQGLRVDITVDDGHLVAMPDGQEPLSLIAVDKTTFRPIAFDGVTIIFSGAGRATGFTLDHGGSKMQLMRIEETKRL